MAPKPLLDLSTIDLETVQYDSEALDAILPQKFELRQLHGVFSFDLEAQTAVGFRDVAGDEFWCRGHFPSKPVFPGVLLVESVAQLCVFFWRKAVGMVDAPGRAMLFGGIDRVKFRDAVLPGDRVISVIKVTELRLRRSKFECQALVNGKIVFTGEITGLLGPDMPEIYANGA